MLLIYVLNRNNHQKDINKIKNEFSEEYFLSLVCQIHEHKKLKNAEDF